MEKIKACLKIILQQNTWISSIKFLHGGYHVNIYDVYTKEPFNR